MKLDALLPQRERVERGTIVWARGREFSGSATGGTTRCQLEGCSGSRVHVRWPSGRLTKPCTRGMLLHENGSWEIQ